MKTSFSFWIFVATPVLMSLHACVCSAFVTSLPTTFISRQGGHLQMAVELEPEPEGGEEMQSIDTIVGTRMKNMGETDEVKSDDGQVYDFWLSTEANGALLNEIRIQIEKDAAKNANFPGFRKGQIPPYARPQIIAFAVQEGLIKTVEAAVAAYGLKALPGSDGEINVNEEVKEMCKGYKPGDSLQFTVNFRAIFDPEKSGRAVEIAETVSEDVETSAE